MKKTIALALPLILFFTSCMSSRPRSAQPSSAAQIIADVPVRTWGDNTCGSAALSAVLNHFGDPVTEHQLDATLDKGLHGGVVSIDLLLEARRRGFDAKLTPGSEELLSEAITRGAPAILLVRVINLPGKRGDFYHYVVADGYDPERHLFRTQFGDGKLRWIHLASIDRAWAAGGRAMLVVNGKSATAATTEETLRRAVSLEENGDRAAAIGIYRELLQRDDSPLIWTDLANALTADGNFSEAEKAYRRAIELAPESRDALNNFAWLLFQQKRLDEAKALALRAVAVNGPDPYAAQETLGEILAARQECTDSMAAFRNAFDAVPAEQPATKASILLGMGRAQKTCGDAEKAKQTFALALQLGPDARTAGELRAELAQ